MPVQGTIRDQAKKLKTNGKKSDTEASAAPADGRERMDKEVVKAVLASPLITSWPNIPGHLQKSVMAALPKLAPKEIPDYHVSRARCHQKEKKHRKQALRADKDEKAGETSDKPIELASEVASAETTVVAQETKEKALPPRPSPPAILEHLVLGINETIKTLERNIDDLKLRLMLMADAINATTTTLPTDRDGLLPTAPRSPSPSPASTDIAPLGWIIVPVLSVSPQSLVNPIPQYCATYNSLVYQWTQLQKTVKSRLKEERWDVLGEERKEIRVIPLGRVEQEMALAVGLRRLACMGIRVDVLEKLLPKSVLHPPRHNITLPFPTATLSVHTSSKRKAQSEKTEKSAKKAKIATSTLPLPHVHYAPLTVKGITTTLPKDGNARKQKRMEEVRQKRVEGKERRKMERKQAFKKGLKGEGSKVPRHGRKKHTKPDGTKLDKVA